MGVHLSTGVIGHLGFALGVYWNMDVYSEVVFLTNTMPKHNLILNQPKSVVSQFVVILRDRLLKPS